MKLSNLVTCGLTAAVILMSSTGFASAGVLDPLINLFTDALTDLTTLITIVGSIALIIAIFAMMFGVGNAWKIAVAAALLIIAVNIPGIVTTIQGL